MSLEKMKKELELDRVKLAKKDMEVKIAERMEEIGRLQEHIKVQEETIARLEKDLK